MAGKQKHEWIQFSLSPSELDRLAQRLGDELYQKRYEWESGLRDGVADYNLPPSQRRNPRHQALEVFLKVVGIYDRGYLNAHNLHLRRLPLILPRLPAAFEGYRILHLSDLHLDLDLSLADPLERHLADLHADLTVVTGDFFDHSKWTTQATLNRMRSLLAILPEPRIGVLGNHDSMESVPFLESCRFQILLNESVSIQRNKSQIWVAGIDDPVYVETHDVSAALRDTSSQDVRILLAHAPDAYREAADAGVDAYLCGHTHGGQVSLPGNISLVRNSKAPRHMGNGFWSHHGMLGYTTSGIGVSTLPVRFFSPPEITVFELKSSP